MLFCPAAQFHPANAQQLFSTSYDDSVRCLDVIKGVSSQVYTHPSETARLNYGPSAHQHAPWPSQRALLNAGGQTQTRVTPSLR